MKSLRFILPLTAAVLVMAPFAVNAAEGDKEAPKPPQRERGARQGGREQANPLTKEESAKLQAAVEKARKDPAVVKAQEAMQKARQEARAAEGEDARKAAMEKSTEAMKNYTTALKAAVLKADPSVEPILKKVGDNPRAFMGGQGQGQGQGGQRGERGGRGGRGAPEKPAEEKK